MPTVPVPPGSIVGDRDAPLGRPKLAQHGANNGRVELPAGLAPQLFSRLAVAHGGAVAPLTRHRAIRVADGDDPRSGSGTPSLAKAVRVAITVPTLVAGAHDGSRPGGAPERR